MEKQKPEEEKISRNRNMRFSNSEICNENQIENEDENENQRIVCGTAWKNLGLLETLEKYDVITKEKRGESVLKIVRHFFLSSKTIKTENAEAAELDKSKISEEEEKHEMEMEGEGTSFESPMSKALRNPVVVRNIVAFLSWSSILTSRLVSKLWLTLCNALLRNSRDDNFYVRVIRIKFRYCDETGTFIKDYDGLLRGEIKTLDSFNDYLAELDEAGRGRFPCKNFVFKDLFLNPYQIKRFFRLQGAEIRGLRLDFCRIDHRRSVNAQSLTDLLMTCCPNVECLTIVKIPLDMERNAMVENQNPDPRHILNINSSDNENGAGNEAGIISNLPRFSLVRLKVLLIDLFYVEQVQELLVKDIVLSSPSLQRVYVRSQIYTHDYDANFDYLTSISKSGLVSQVTVKPEMKNLEGLKKFAQSKPSPRLDYLCLYLDYVDFSGSEGFISFENFLPVASALLDSSKNSLETLHMNGARGGQVTRLLKEGGVPTLENVRSVSLSCIETGTTNPLPVAAFNRIFPNALQLSIAGESGSRGLLLNTAPLNANADADADADADGEKSGENEIKIETGKGVVPQITCLFVYDAFTKDVWLNLPTLFCNVQELFVNNENLVPVLPLVWQLGKSCWRLKKLTLKSTVKITDVPLDQLSPAVVFPGLDAAFTGFPEEACLQLLSMYPEILDEEIAQELRINSSILDLKDLEELHIRFLILSNEELPQNVLTVVSGAYAFEWMRMKQEQQLKVLIQTELCPGYDQTTSYLTAKNQRMENILKPLKPFADISHTF